MKSKLFFITFLFSVIISAQVSANKRSIITEYKIDENSIIFDKTTGEKIMLNDFERLIKTYPNSTILVKDEDSNGNPTSFYFVRDQYAEDNSKPKVKGVKIKRNDIFNKLFNLESIDSKYSVVILQLTLQLPMINVEGIKEAEQAALKRGFTSVILTSSNLNTSKIFAQNHNLESIIIPNASNLIDGFNFKRGPMFLILNKDKEIIESLKYYYEVEEVLSEQD